MKLREAIEKDLTNPDVMMQIRVLALDGSLDETILQVQWFERTEPFGNDPFCEMKHHYIEGALTKSCFDPHPGA
ncbi:hypothetical protein Bpfe_019187 [Biomphalaria pfeifferi]|uniref:Uncharacterized protein n=1 Tax=Biomphalaria pfeifferi TaxID=112525 RepID=A0AAD8BCG4_BIOPF|nr:hypothetical protein Bpfe_019187 [Biomphalaria pfeifferi]